VREDSRQDVEPLGWRGGGVSWGCFSAQRMRLVAAPPRGNAMARSASGSCGIARSRRHVQVRLVVREGNGAIPPVGSQRAVGLGDVHPPEQVRVAGHVETSIRRPPADPLVDPADTPDDRLGVLHGAERRGRKERAGALQPPPGIALVARVPRHACHRQRVQRLQQQGTDPGNEHRRICMHPPDRVGQGEPALTRFVPDDRGLGSVVLPGNPVAQRDGQASAYPVMQRRAASTSREVFRLTSQLCAAPDDLVLCLIRR